MTDRKLHLSGVVAGVVAVTFCGIALAQSHTRASANEGAGWGALAGLVFGGKLEDVVEGAVVGGVAGAVVGSAEAQEAAARQQAQAARAQQIREQERVAYEQEAQRRAKAQAEYEHRLAMERQNLAAQQQAAQPAQSSAGPDEEMLVRAFGQDTVTGWYALRDCKHNNALIAATAGENASAASHQLAATWLRAIIAFDQKRTNSGNAALQNLIVIDPEISTMEEAEEAAQDLLAELRVERRAAGIRCGAG